MRRISKTRNSNARTMAAISPPDRPEDAVDSPILADPVLVDCPDLTVNTIPAELPMTFVATHVYVP